MGACLGGWRTVPRLIFDDSSDTLSLDVLAERISDSLGLDVTSGADVARVEFTIVPATGSPFIVNVVNRSVSFPNFTDSTPPLPGSWGGGQIPRWWFSTTISMASFAAGRFTVSAVIRGAAVGSSPDDRPLPSLLFYNNKDGSFSRGNTVHCDPVNGNDSNSGLSSGAKVLTIQRAFDVAVNGGGSAAGGTILLYSGTHQFAGSHFAATTIEVPDFWVTLKPATGLTKANVKIARDSANALRRTGTQCRLRFRDVTIVGTGPQIERPNNGGAGVSWWFDDCRRTNDRELTTHSILAYEGYMTPWCGDTQGTSGEESYYTSCHADYCIGFDSMTLAMGCRSTGGTVAFKFTSDQSHVSDCLVESIRSYFTSPGVPIPGFFDGAIDGQWTAAQVSGARWRFRPTFATTGTQDMVAALPTLVQSNRYGVCIRDWNGAADGAYPVLGYGTDGTGQYVDLDLTGTSAPVHTSTCQVLCGRVQGSQVLSYNEDIHCDVAKWEGGTRTDTSLDNVRVVDCTIRGLVGSQTPVVRMLIRSCTDAGLSEDWTNVPATDSLWLGCTLAGSILFDTPGLRSQMRDCWVQTRNLPSVTGWTFGGCLYEVSTGISPPGWSQTTQALALAHDPLVSPFDFTARSGGPLDGAAISVDSVGHENGGDVGASAAVTLGNWSRVSTTIQTWPGAGAIVANSGAWVVRAGQVVQWQGGGSSTDPGAWSCQVGVNSAWPGINLPAIAATWEVGNDGVTPLWKGAKNTAISSAGTWAAAAGTATSWSGPTATTGAGAWGAVQANLATWPGVATQSDAGDIWSVVAGVAAGWGGQVVVANPGAWIVRPDQRATWAGPEVECDAGSWYAYPSGQRGGTVSGGPQIGRPQRPKRHPRLRWRWR